MERHVKRHTSNVTVNKNDFLVNIHKEYSLKRKTFYPSPTSPNLFMGKLEFRMNIYYNNLYKSIKEDRK